MNFANLRYTQPASINPVQYVHYVYAKSYKVADVYDEYTLPNIFVEGVDTSICHCIKVY